MINFLTLVYNWGDFFEIKPKYSLLIANYSVFFTIYLSLNLNTFGYT